MKRTSFISTEDFISQRLSVTCICTFNKDTVINLMAVDAAIINVT